MNKKVIENLAKTLKLDVKELTQAIETEGEVDFKLPEESRYLSKEELEAIKDNHGKTRYDAGKTAGSEMLLKDLSEKVGFDETVKDGESFIKTFKTNVLKEANAEPNTKIKELQTSLETLQSKIGEKDAAYENLQVQVKTEKRLLEAQSHIPELPESLGLKKSEAANLLLSGIEFKDDGIYKNGTLLKDELEKPINLETYMKSSVTERGWGVESPSGRGGGSGGAGGGSSTGLPKSMKEYEAHLQEKGIRPGSVEANSLLQEAAKESPEILG